MEYNAEYIEKLVVPSTLETIGTCAFSETNIKEIEVNNVKLNAPFGYNSKLEYIKATNYETFRERLGGSNSLLKNVILDGVKTVELFGYCPEETQTESITTSEAINCTKNIVTE